MFSSRQPWFTTLWLLSPIFVLVALLGLLSVIPKGAESSGNSIVFIGVLSPIAGGVPILRWEGQAKVFKALVFVAYYIACAAAMFIAGWAALGIFRLAR
jgi:hypothetical protein